jgi:hypothetical protein
LQGRGPDLFIGRRRREIVQGLDAPTHTTHLRQPAYSLVAPGLRGSSRRAVRAERQNCHRICLHNNSAKAARGPISQG